MMNSTTALPTSSAPPDYSREPESHKEQEPPEYEMGYYQHPSTAGIEVGAA